MNGSRFSLALILPPIMVSLYWIFGILLVHNMGIMTFIMGVISIIATIVASAFFEEFIKYNWNINVATLEKQDAMFIHNFLLSTLHANIGWFGVTGALGVFTFFPIVVYITSSFLFLVMSIIGLLCLLSTLRKSFS